jgi:heme exporter protein D
MFQFESFQDFIAMAGHGPYVWGSYAVSLAVMTWLVASPVIRKRQLRRELLIQRARAARREG